MTDLPDLSASDLAGIRPDRTLDTVGHLCPIPIIQTAKVVKEMAPGEVVLVIADDWGVKVDMPAWCKMSHNELLGITEGEKVLKAYVRKTEAHRRIAVRLPEGSDR
jgi:TusA-related sulfurtransferase